MARVLDSIEIKDAACSPARDPGQKVPVLEGRPRTGERPLTLLYIGIGRDLWEQARFSALEQGCRNDREGYQISSRYAFLFKTDGGYGPSSDCHDATKIVIPANSVCALRSKPRTKFSRRSATGVSPIMGQYANYLEIGHNEHEFVFDFGESYENDEPTRVHTRIVTGPVYAKVFLKLLQSAMAEYEESYGPLDVREFRK